MKVISTGAFSSSVVSVTRQRRHAQLVPEPYQEVQVCLTPKPDLLCIHCAAVLTIVSIAPQTCGQHHSEVAGVDSAEEER